MDEPLRKLKQKLDELRFDRDKLNTEVLEERAKFASFEEIYAKKQNDLARAKQELYEREGLLEKFNMTLRESENTYTKLLLNTDRLIGALDQEYSSLRKK